jgi:hypothetical protein
MHWFKPHVGNLYHRTYTRTRWMAEHTPRASMTGG